MVIQVSCLFNYSFAITIYVLGFMLRHVLRESGCVCYMAVATYITTYSYFLQGSCLCWWKNLPFSQNHFFLCLTNGMVSLILRNATASGEGTWVKPTCAHWQWIILFLSSILLPARHDDHYLSLMCYLFDRYVDMIMNPDVAEVFRSRARVILFTLICCLGLC
jgi:hypothetical protein